MQENLSKFKYSSICKILCVILAFVTFAFSAWHGVLALTSIFYKVDGVYSETENTDDWTNSMPFYRLLMNDALACGYQLTNKDEINYYTKYFNENKQKYVDEAFEQVKILKREAKDNAEYDYNEYYDEELGEVVEESTTFIDYFNYTSEYSVYAEGRELFTVHLHGDMTKKDVEEKFNKAEEKIKYSFESVYFSRYYNLENTDAKYYAKYGDDQITNDYENPSMSYIGPFDIKKVLSSDYYLIVKDGKLESKGICKTVAGDVYSVFTNNNKYAENIDLYIYFNAKDMSKQNLADAISSLKTAKYSNLYHFSDQMVKVSENLEKHIAISAVSLLLSFVFAFVYFSVIGKKDSESETKLFFYDYIPFEIGLSVAGGLSGLAIYLVALFEDRFDLSILVLYLGMVALIVCWVLLFMLSSSFSRNFRSERKFYKYLLTYWVFFAIGKCIKYTFLFIKSVFRAIGNFNRKVFASAKRTFNAFLFKTHSFKRNILAVTIGWLILNFILFGIICACYVEEFAFGFFVALALIVLDFFTLRKFGEYVKNLDMIIDASSRHEDILVDLETLDLSLKTLAESMRYTNAELQNAIAKAVKDERLRTELITNVSHDLKTPLTSIITYVDLLSKCDIQDEKAKEYIKVLDDKGGKLKRLIDDLIEASKVTSGNVTVNLTPINLTELCLQSTVDAQTDFEKAGLELVVKQGEKPTIVIADGSKANRVIENLLSNARKYSAKASRVYVNVYTENNFGVFEIKNVSAQALDITPDELTERFVRGDKSRNQDGNGLGLSIAKELCNLQNGKLDLQIDGDLFKARVLFPTK